MRETEITQMRVTAAAEDEGKKGNKDGMTTRKLQAMRKKGRKRGGEKKKRQRYRSRGHRLGTDKADPNGLKSSLRPFNSLHT